MTEYPPGSGSPHQIPLVESVLAFQFVRAANPWDSLFFGKLHSELQPEFPRVETLNVAEIRLGIGQGFAVGTAGELKRFLREDGGIVITVGADTLGVSVLARQFTGGYPGWTRLRDTALTTLSRYMALTRPDAIRQIGVRYINAVLVNPTGFRLDQYVSRASGVVPERLLNESQPFALRVERTRETTPTEAWREVLNLLAHVGPSGEPQLVLDVDEIYLPTAGSTDKNVHEIAERLHESVGDVFRTVVNESFRRSLLVSSPSAQPRHESSVA